MLPLIAALAALGVQVKTVDVATCGPVRGLYETTTRTVTICLKDGKFDYDARKVLRHEAVHAIQHCRSGLDNMTAMANTEAYYEIATKDHYDLADSLTPYYMAGMEDEVINLEAEAFVLSRIWSDSQTIEALNATCSQPALTSNP